MDNFTKSFETIRTGIVEMKKIIDYQKKILDEIVEDCEDEQVKIILAANGYRLDKYLDDSSEIVRECARKKLEESKKEG